MIKDIMSKNLIMCETVDNVLFVSNLMKKYDVGLVLITFQNKLFGLVTDRDLTCKMAKDTDMVEKYVNQRIITIDENGSIKESLQKMKKHKIKRLIVTKENKVTGVLSISDILASNKENVLVIETLKSIFAINRNNNYFKIDVHEFPL